jgi:hypothetical protein
MINKTQAKILRALQSADLLYYTDIMKATGLSNPFGYLADLITYEMVVNVSQNQGRALYKITRDGIGVIDVYGRIEARKELFKS